MSFCLDCQFTKDIAQCVTSLTVGTISQALTAVYVYVENKSTGQITRFSATSTAGGVVTVTRGTNIFMTDTPYEIWVTLATATNTDQRLAVTYSGSSTQYFCVYANFKYVTDDTGAVPTYSAQTLTLV